MTRIFLVRHGENPANLTKEFSHKRIDYDLNAKGRLQAVQTAEHFSRFAIDGIYSSPLKRAYRTAERIAAAIRKPVAIAEELREIDVGYLENEPPTKANWEMYFAVVDAWLDGDRGKRFRDGESYTELVERFSRFLIDVTGKHDGRSVVAVGHGGIFALAIADLCAVDDKKAFSVIRNHNCSIGVVETVIEDGRLNVDLIDWANHSHLSGEAADFVDGLPYKGTIRCGRNRL